MRCIVISDTHGDSEVLESIRNHWTGHVDATFYCGDSELNASDPVFKDWYTVMGNMDYDSHFPTQVVTTIKEIKIFMTHGHLFNVNRDLSRIEDVCEDLHAQLAFFGHTHQLGAEKIGKIIFVNPGSISQPRGQYIMIGGTYALISIENNQCTVDYYNRQHQLVPQLTCHFSI